MTGVALALNGVAPRFDLEPFSVYAAREMAAAPLHVPGVCFNPACSCAFVASRPWAQYCGPSCAAVAKAEFRMIGHKAARPLLVWRLGKYAPSGTPAADRTRAARRYISRLQSQWLEDRAARQTRAA